MRLVLLGFGLLAGSIASAVKQAKLQTVVCAVSSKNTLEKAKKHGAADEFYEYEEVKKWLPNSDLILICSPIKHIISQIEVLKNNANLVSKQTIVSDIGSTKEEICKAGFSLPEPFLFVGGHPMAGSEKRGFEHSDPSIFENAYWLYCLPEKAKELPSVLHELLNFLGSRPLQISPQVHDEAMAWLSHAPQFISTSINTGVSSKPAELSLHLAGRGFRDMTRLAASSWDMWKDIFESNKKNIQEALKVYANEILNLSNAQIDEIEKKFLLGNDIRHKLESGKNLAYPLYEVIARIPDEPGSILKALQPLADNDINVRDIELMKVREGVAGTLLLSFKTESEAVNAIKILGDGGIDAVNR